MKPRKIPPFDLLARISETIETDDPDNEPLTFGKHRGQTPNEIFYDDPQYLIWLKKTGSSIPSQDLYEEALIEVYKAKENIPVDLKFNSFNERRRG